MLNRTKEENFTWAARQAYIELSTGIIAAAHLKVGATLIEGFDNGKFVYFIEKKSSLIVITSIFHTNRYPKSKYRK